MESLQTEGARRGGPRGLTLRIGASLARLRGRRRGRREEQHAQRQTLFEQAIDGSGDLISIGDPDHRFVFVNKAFLATYGLTREEVLHIARQIVCRKADWTCTANRPATGAAV